MFSYDFSFSLLKREKFIMSGSAAAAASTGDSSKIPWNPATGPGSLNSIPSMKVFHIDGRSYPYVKHAELNREGSAAGGPVQRSPVFTFDSQKKWTPVGDPLPETINMQGLKGLKNGFIFHLKPTQDLQNVQKITGTCYLTQNIDAKAEPKSNKAAKANPTRKIKCEISGDQLLPILDPLKTNREDLTMLGTLKYAFSLSTVYTSPDAIIRFFEDLMTYLLSLRFLRDPGIFSLDGMDVDIPLQDLQEMGINHHNYRMFIQIHCIAKIKVISYDTNGDMMIDPKKYSKVLKNNIVQTDFWERWSGLFLNVGIIKEKQISIAVLEAECDNIIKATKCVKSICRTDDEADDRSMFHSSVSELPRSRVGVRSKKIAETSESEIEDVDELLVRLRNLEKRIVKLEGKKGQNQDRKKDKKK